jgi:hypothetical protein
MNVEIGIEAAQLPEKEIMNWIFVAVWHLVLAWYLILGTWYLLLGTLYVVLATWYLVRGKR